MLAGWRLQVIRTILVGLQWCLITIGLGAVVVYSAPALEGLVSPHVDLTFMVIAAFLLAGLLGVIVRSLVAAILLAMLMCAGSTVLFAITMFAPTWDGSVVRSGDLENFVTTRMLLYTLIMTIPALIGVLFGNLAGGALDERHEILTSHPTPQDGWWNTPTGGDR